MYIYCRLLVKHSVSGNFLLYLIHKMSTFALIKTQLSSCPFTIALRTHQTKRLQLFKQNKSPEIEKASVFYSALFCLAKLQSSTEGFFQPSCQKEVEFPRFPANKNRNERNILAVPSACSGKNATFRRHHVTPPVAIAGCPWTSPACPLLRQDVLRIEYTELRTSCSSLLAEF